MGHLFADYRPTSFWKNIKTCGYKLCHLWQESGVPGMDDHGMKNGKLFQVLGVVASHSMNYTYWHEVTNPITILLNNLPHHDCSPRRIPYDSCPRTIIFILAYIL